MKIRSAFLLLLITAVSLVMAPVAQALTIDNVYLMTNNRDGTGGGLSTGYHVHMDAFVSPSGTGTTVSARQVTGGTNNVNLTYFPSPLFPNDYYIRMSFDINPTGQWEVTATDGTDTVTRLTPVLYDVRQLPLAQNLSVSSASGDFTPTLAWTAFDTAQFPAFSGSPSEDSDDFGLMVRVRDSGARTLWQSSKLSTGTTSYTLPSGVLSATKDYILEVLLSHYNYQSGAWVLSNRSETFLHYVTPGATGLTIGNTFVYTINRGGDAAAAEYILVVEALANDAGGNPITSVWAYNGSYHYELSPGSYGIFGTHYVYTTPYAGQTGIWEIRATNSLGETVSAYTHNFDKPLQLPLVTGVTFTDQTTSPTVSWDPSPSGQIDNYAVRVTSDGYTVLYQGPSLPNTATSFQIPSGIMSVGTQYVIRIQAFDYDEENGVSYMENRSDYHTYFTPASWTPTPGDFDGDCDVDGKNLAALIANPSGFDLAAFAANFGENLCQ